MSLATEIAPVVAAAAIAGVGSVLTWVWAKLTGQKALTVKELLGEVVEAVVMEVLAHPEPLSVARARLEAECVAALKAIGITGKPAAFAVKLAVEQGVARVRLALNHRAAARLPRQFDELATAAGDVTQAFRHPLAPTVPVLDLGLESSHPGRLDPPAKVE